MPRSAGKKVSTAERAQGTVEQHPPDSANAMGSVRLSRTYS